MGRQDGILQLKGELGGMSFYKTTDGYLVRKKGGVNKNRILNDPAFQRTRENGQEFGKAGAELAVTTSTSNCAGCLQKQILKNGTGKRASHLQKAEQKGGSDSDAKFSYIR